ncbi:MAG: isopentenyl-diphosphate Delta-isomerase [Paracoccaceae bacterium]
MSDTPIVDPSIPPAAIPAWVDGVLQPVDKLQAHQNGWRHQAISVFVFAQGHLLLQRRALGKYHTPGLWANTCCTHPHWGEAATDTAPRRLGEELNLVGVALDHVGQVEYRADVGGGMIEHEVVEMFVGHMPQCHEITPNPAEVSAVQWITKEALLHKMAQTPDAFTPWLRIYLDQHADVFWP